MIFYFQDSDPLCYIFFINRYDLTSEKSRVFIESIFTTFFDDEFRGEWFF